MEMTFFLPLMTVVIALILVIRKKGGDNSFRLVCGGKDIIII